MHLQKRNRLFAYVPAAILSIWSSAALTCSLSLEKGYAAGRGFHPAEWVKCAFNCLSADRTLSALLAGLLLWGLIRLRTDSFSRRDRVLAGLFGFVFAAMQALGVSYMETGTWDMLFGNPYCILRTLFVLPGRTVFWAAGTLLAFKFCDEAAQRVSPHPVRRNPLLVNALLLLLCWLPYFIVFYPGTNSIDTNFQLLQYFGYDNPFRYVSPLQGKDIYMSNHLPVLTTWLYGLFVQAGYALGSSRMGVAMYVLAQMFAFTSVFTSTFDELSDMGLPTAVRKGLFVFTALFPLFPLQAICMVKDVPFALLTLTMARFTVRAVRTRGECFKNLRYDLLLALNAALLILIKSQGVYIILISAVPFFVLWRKHWLRIAAVLLIPILLFETLWLRILLPTCNIAPGGKQEVLGMLFQQTARSLYDYPEDVSEEEKQIIDAIVGYDNLVENYSFTSQDPIKYSYDQFCSSKTRSDYYKVWFKMLLRHPDSYLQAWLAIGTGGFTLDKYSSLYYNRFETTDTVLELKGITNLSLRHNAIRVLNLFFDLFGKLPLAGLLFRMALPVWGILFALTLTLRRRGKGMFAVYLPLLTQMGILFVSPLINFRYMLPFLFTALYLMLLAVYDLPRSEKEN